MGAPLVRLGWRPPGLSVPLPPLSPLLHKNPEELFLLVPAYPGGPGRKAVKRLLLLLSNVCNNYNGVLF